MKKHAILASLVTLLTPAAALAHDGLHFHPHGVEYGWMAAAALGFVAVAVLAWVRGRK